MARVIKFEGRQITVPDDATDDEIRQILSSEPPAPVDLPLPTGAGGEGFNAAAPALTPNDPGYKPPGYNQGWDFLDNTGAGFFDAARKGAAAILGAPVDIINAAPMLANLIPGVDGVGPMSDTPFGGSETLDNVFRFGGLLPEAPEPQGGFQRAINRSGFEVGASAVPVLGFGAKAATTATSAIRTMASQPKNLGQAFMGPMLEAASVAPGKFAAREGAGALAAGLGAGGMNEAFMNEQFGADNFWSDFGGSVAGAGALGVGRAVGGAGMNLWAGATGNPKFMDNVAGEEVANRLINNSSTMQDQARRLQDAGLEPQRLDTQELVDILRRPAAVEEVIPGYQANIGDRAQDPGLSTFAYNQDAVNPGAANSRRVGNEAVVNERMDGLEPGGDPARLRANLQGAVDTEIAGAQQAAMTEQQQLDHILQNLTPTTPYAEDRGAAVRTGVNNAEGFARSMEDRTWRGIDGEVDPAPLAQGLDAARADLPVARQQAVADLEQTLGIPASFEGPVDLEEITALRSRLTTAQRNALRGPQPDADRANIIGRYIEQVDEFMSSGAIPDSTRAQIEDARGVTRQVNEDFNRPGDPLAQVGATNEGRPVVPDSGVAKRFLQPDSGQASNIDRLLAQTDMTSSAASVHAALRDEMLADIQKRGLVGKPDQLDTYLNQHSRVFDRFPDLREELTGAGQQSRRTTQATEQAETTARDLTTPGRSATASYLKFGDESVGDAIRTVTTSAKPREAVRELLTRASTPEARQDLRSALWTEVRRRGQESASGMTGQQRWNGRRLRDMFNDPKVSAVADELWADNPDDLADIKNVFEALASSEGSTRARAANTSGTAQSLSGKYDPSLTAASIASRARSVNRGVLSPTVAIIDVATTWLRGKSAQVQSRAIDTLASSVVNNPGLAADLLEKYNPATAAARRRMITQKYGIRATQVLNLLDEIEENETDDGRLKEIIMEGLN